jgi:tetratricopeptide (TPR) repeat protein
MYWRGLNWQKANDYCGSLLVGGLSGWRLPTLDEVEGAVEIIRVSPNPVCPSADVATHGGCRDQELAPGAKYSGLALKGRIDLFNQSMTIWTATPYRTGSTSAWTVGLTPIPNSFVSLAEMTRESLSQTESNSAWESELKSVQWTPLSTTEMTEAYMGVVCVRPMESNLLQTAKAAQVDHPVPDIQTLQTFIPLNKSRLAYQAGNYQESIAQAKIAISLQADPAVAYWGIGISYGRLGQWDQAIANLQTALSIDKNAYEVQTALKWAKDGLKAAKKGKQPKEPSPTWN